VNGLDRRVPVVSVVIPCLDEGDAIAGMKAAWTILLTFIRRALSLRRQRRT
jgi:hypothetical protein